MKLILLLIGLTCMVQSLNAQKIDPASVPMAIQTQFVKDFPGVNANWNRQGNRYVAAFEQNKYKMQTVYNTYGTRLETRVTIEEKELPEAAREYVKSHNLAGITEASKIITDLDKVSFKVLAGTQYIDFDAKGNYLRSAEK
jgi:hypothetical protein